MSRDIEDITGSTRAVGSSPRVDSELAEQRTVDDDSHIEVVHEQDHLGPGVGLPDADVEQLGPIAKDDPTALVDAVVANRVMALSGARSGGGWPWCGRRRGPPPASADRWPGATASGRR